MTAPEGPNPCLPAGRLVARGIAPGKNDPPPSCLPLRAPLMTTGDKAKAEAQGKPQVLTEEQASGKGRMRQYAGCSMQ